MATTSRSIIGRNVRTVRKELGLSLLKFSILTKLSKATIVNIESGRTGYNLNLLDNIVVFTNFSLSDLTNERFTVKNDFREKMIKFYSKDAEFYTILHEKPEIAYAIKKKILNDDFLKIPKEIKDIRLHLLTFHWSYSGSSISTALKRMSNLIKIQEHPLKKGTFLYSKKI